MRFIAELSSNLDSKLNDLATKLGDGGSTRHRLRLKQQKSRRAARRDALDRFQTS